MELNVYNESVIINSVVNGLIAVATIWAFWTPFLIIVVVPLMNAIFKDTVCGYALDNAGNIEYAAYLSIVDLFNNLYYAGIITDVESAYINNMLLNIYYSINEMNLDSTAADDIIENDPAEITSMNMNLFIIMSVTALFIIISFIMLAVFLIYKYNLNGHRILAFNLIMALIIVIIEVVFFSTVATKYNAFTDESALAKLLATKITDYLS
jgi:hypothetical protein